MDSLPLLILRGSAQGPGLRVRRLALPRRGVASSRCLAAPRVRADRRRAPAGRAGRGTDPGAPRWGGGTRGGATANGRPFSARRGWALLLLAAGLEPAGLPPDVRSKLRRHLRERDLWAQRARFATRSERHVLRAHSSDVARIAVDPEVVRSGAGAAADAGLPLVAPGAPLELYVDAATADRLVATYRLTPSPRGNVTLRVVSDEVRAWLTGPVAPWPAVALDLAEDGDPRSRDVARAALTRR